MMQFGNTVLFVDDVPSVLEFYCRAFGFEITFYDPDFGYGELQAGGATLAVGSHQCGERMMPQAYVKSPSGHPEGVEIAFYTSDVSAAYARAVAAGAAPLTAPRTMPWGQTVAYVRSIEGTIIGLCTPWSVSADTLSVSENISRKASESGNPHG